MAIQSKLFLYFLALGFMTMLIIGVFSFSNIQDKLTTSTVEHLSSVASLQKQRVNQALDQYIQETRFITSLSQLSPSTAEYAKTGQIASLERITNIITNAKQSVSNIYHVSILDINGQVIASTNPDALGTRHADQEYYLIGKHAYTLTDIFKDVNNTISIRVVGPLIFGGEVVGVAEIITNADPLIKITEDYTGLGETGEVLLAKKNANGDALFLTPLRFDSGAALARAISQDSVNEPITQAILGKEGIFTKAETFDYRDKSIFAVTRSIDAVGWGLEAKIDQEEVLLPITKFRNTFLFVALFILFAILAMSLFISNTLVSPIIKLTLRAHALEQGDFSVRANIKGKDEIGLLARTFDDMAGRLQDLYRGLEQKVHDRTQDLERAKAKDEAMLASIGDGLVATDTDERILLVNKAFERILGWKEGEAQGKLLSEVISMVDGNGKPVPESERLVSKTLKERSTTTTTTTMYYRRKDGISFPVAVTVAPIFVGSELIGAVEVFRDITKEKDIDKAKTEFVSLASHQLRTPLSTVSWYAEMLLAGDAGKLNEEQKKYLDEVYKGNKRMIELVNALLNVSRMELGTFIIEPEPTNVVELVRSVVNEQKPMIDEKKLKLNEKYAENLPKLNADPKLLRMVIQNLLSNAVKYTPEDGKIEISLSLNDKKNVLLKVSDTGYGIPKSQQDKIFTKLFRADNVREKDTEGTGLGLYIIKAIVEHSGGRVWFESEENKGTTFYVTLSREGMKKKEGSKALS